MRMRVNNNPVQDTLSVAVELFGEPYAPLDEVLAKVDAISVDDVRAACAEFFAPERQTLLSLGPE